MILTRTSFILNLDSVNGKDTFIIPDVDCGNTKSEGPIVKLQNKCGSVVREYIDVNPPQFISNVKPKHLTKVGNIVKVSKSCLLICDRKSLNYVPKYLILQFELN